MRRRQFITLLGSAAATWPLAASAQQPAMPVIEFLNSASPAPYARMVTAFRQGLSEAGYVADRNAAIQMRDYALVIGADSFFISQSKQVAELTVRHAVPAIFQYREFAAAGGLMSYGGSLTDAYRHIGVYTGRILKGEKPADLPVVQ